MAYDYAGPGSTSSTGAGANVNTPAPKYMGQSSSDPYSSNNPVVKSTVNKSNVSYPQGFESSGQTQIIPNSLSTASSLLGLLGGSPVGVIGSMGKALYNQSQTGMNKEAEAEFAKLDAIGGSAWNMMSPAEKVAAARKPQMDKQLSHAFIGTPTTQAQRDAVARGEVSPTGQIMSSSYNGPTMASTPNAAMPNSTAESQDQGLFKPVTFRSGTGTATLTPEGMTTSLAEPYAGISDMVGEGQGLLGQAAGLAEQAPERFEYAFDPEASAQRLFSQRSALLEPAFEQQRIQAAQQAQGMGRLGLQLSNASLGLGGDGMSQPEFAGMNAAQAQALAQLSAQSTDDAFGQELQRQSAAQNTYQLNQAAEQQQLANLQGLGQGMFTSGLQAPALEAQLTGIPLQSEALRQNYELGLDSNDIARMQAEAAIKNANYQPNGWLTGLTSLGTAFAGSAKGSNFIADLFT